MADQAVIERDVIQALRGCYDPEIPVDIYELGLIYGIRVASDGGVDIRMTLTAPSCPAAQELPAQVEDAVRLHRLESTGRDDGPEHAPGSPRGEQPVGLAPERSEELRLERRPGDVHRTGKVRG